MVEQEENKEVPEPASGFWDICSKMEILHHRSNIILYIFPFKTSYIIHNIFEKSNKKE